MQSETGLALVYFSFFLVMYREGLPSTILTVGFTVAVIVVCTLLLETKVLLIILSVIAAIIAFIVWQRKRRHFYAIIPVVGIWLLTMAFVALAFRIFLSIC